MDWGNDHCGDNIDNDKKVVMTLTNKKVGDDMMLLMPLITRHKKSFNVFDIFDRFDMSSVNFGFYRRSLVK